MMEFKQSVVKTSIAIVTVLIATLLIEYPKIQNYYDKQLHAYYFDVGQGDSSLIKSETGDLILIDGGPNRSVIHKLDEVLPFWVREIDLVIVSHSHADHISGLIHVFDKYDIKCIVYDDSDLPISVIEEEFRSAVEKEGAKVVLAQDYENLNSCISDSNLRIENNSLTLLPENRVEQLATDFDELRVLGAQDNENYESIITKVSYKDLDLLYTGDAEKPVQESLLSEIGKDIEILKIPHQGASDSYSEYVLERWSPELGVISVGLENRFGHPHKETLEGYENMGIKILRTDQDGSIHIKSDGNTWMVIE